MRVPKKLKAWRKAHPLKWGRRVTKARVRKRKSLKPLQQDMTKRRRPNGEKSE